MAIKKNTKPTEKQADFSKLAKVIEDVSLSDEVEKSFLSYAYMVILSRAIPDARDGLKPVHRRILWSMFDEGITPEKSHVKSAKIVGNTMGNYHPHGDSAIYEAMVGLVQEHNLSVPLIDPHGNFGGSPGSTPAAARYTEARLGKAALPLLAELKEDGTDFAPNYDATRVEPTVLPVQYPNLLINGGTGIAVGVASKMAPHNPNEIIDAARWLLTHPTATTERLMDFVPGPDFPTGGRILGQDAIKAAYETGRGVIKIQGTSVIEPVGRGKHHIIFTSLPYEISAEKVIEKIKELVGDNKIQGIADMKDLAGRQDKTRLVIETKAGVNPQALLYELYKQTPLEVSFGINNTAILDGEPKVLGLKELLEVFLDHRVNVVTRRTASRKDKRDKRLHLIEGLLKALANIDEVIKIIRNSVDTETARASLIKKFKLDEVQADYILDIPLRRLTKFDQIQLNDEKKKLLEELKGLNKILSDEKELRAVIAKELEEVRKVLDRPRRSEIVGGDLSEHLEAAKAAAVSTSLEVEDEPCGVFLSYKGGLVRSTKLTASKPMLSQITSTTRSKFIAVSNKGRAFRLDTLHVGTKEASVNNVLPEKLPNGEKIIALTPVDLSEGKTGGIAIGTKNGIVKITSPQWPVRSDDFSIISLENDDEIISAHWIDDVNSYDVAFITSDTSLLTFPASKVRPQGLSGGGMAGIKLSDKSTVLAFGVIPTAIKDKAMVVTVSDGQRGKTTPYSLYPQKGRGTGGVRTQAFLKGESYLIYAFVGTEPVLLDKDKKELSLPEVINKRDASGKLLDDGTLAL
jgi:DNA gyrase subunit A